MKFAMKGSRRLFAASVAATMCLFSIGCLDTGIFNTLTVRSVNPTSHIPIEVVSTDRKGASATATSFTRLYKHGTVITLTAPTHSGGNTFSSWTGCTSSTSATCTVTLTGDTTVIATYITPADGSTAQIGPPGLSDPRLLSGNDDTNPRKSSASDRVEAENPLTRTSAIDFVPPLGDNSNLPGNDGQDSGTSDYQPTVAPESAPIITSSDIAAGKSGTIFSYQIVATNTPSSFDATGLPAGLSMDSSTGLIWGIPTNSGTVHVSLSATNGCGTATGTLYLMISGS